MTKNWISNLKDIFKRKQKSRAEYNEKLLQLLTGYIETHTDIRFMQALYNLFMEKDQDLFYEEPVDTYDRLIEKLKR